MLQPETSSLTYNPTEDVNPDVSARTPLSPPQAELSHDPIRGPIAPYALQI